MPSLFDTFRFTASDGITDTPVFPFNSGLKRQWQREDGTRSYRLKVTTKLLFRKDDYVYFKSLYDLGDCTEIALLIENKCGGVWSTWHSGTIPIFQGDYNTSRCEVSFDVLPADVYECANKGFNDKSNWLNYATPTRIQTFVTGATIETTDCDSAETFAAIDLDLHFSETCWGGTITSSQDPHPTLAWRPIIHFQYFIAGIPWTMIAKTTWARETIDSASPPPGDGWINTAGTTWVRPVSVSFPKISYEFSQAGIQWEAQAVNPSPISNGRALGEVLTDAVLALGCDFDSVVSDFFGINPDATAPTNDAYTFAADNLQNVYLFQKSDIVRATASNDATRFNLSLKEFFEEIKIFNLFYTITNVLGVKTLRIEHYTYFNGVNGLNLVTLDGGKYIVGLESFKSEKEVPNFESFAYQESYRPKFLVKRITYPAQCATTQGDERTANQLNTDFGGLVENQDAGLDGFFLMATHDIGGGNFLMNTLGGEANGAFSWDYIIPKLWADGRFHLAATANVPGYTVNSIAKVNAQPKITIPFCCDDTFEPSELINTQFGWCEVKTAEQDTKRGTIALTLLH